ncbi:MAG TPA: GntR family transcriptional regulator [Edaphobacter sp.]|nr:GntR family transcriptional regulator [Edaphobacter sp.]
MNVRGSALKGTAEVHASKVEVTEKGASHAGLAGLPPGLLRPLDKKSFEPLYAQIQSRLKELIRTGEIGVNDSLPGEAELSRIFSISRMTARHALQGLTNEGLTYRERGRGTFVSPPKVEKEITHLLGFSAQIRLLGMKASTRVLASAVIPAEGSIAESLELSVHDEVLRLQRLRLADDEPIAIEEVWIPRSRFPGVEEIDFGKHSLYETLRDRYGVRIGSSRETIGARQATAEESRLLRIAPRSSLLEVSRTLLDVDGQPMEVAHSLYRGDRYRAVLTIPAVEQR